MKKIFAVVLLLLVAFSANSMMAQEMPPIPVDEAVKIGKLENGLTYYIRHNDYPEHRVNFYIAQRVGTMQEEDNQQGLAHFLEHMAFNGSEHFKGNGIIDYTRSLGLSFGGDLNAGTSFNYTVYYVSNVPSTRQSALDSCLLIMKDWSHGLLLTDKDINEERGVIHQEWRQTTDPKERMDTRQLKNMFPGSKYGERMIIGLMDIVDNFPCQVLRDYYDKWYRPDNQAIIVVGDIDVDYTEAKIREMFKDIPAPAADAAPVVEFPVPDNDQPIFVIDKDKEQARNIITVNFKHDNTSREDKTNLNYLIEDYATDVICMMINERLKEKALEEDCPYISAYCEDDSYLWTNSKDAFSLTGYPKDNQTEATLQALVTETLRAAQHGFTATEYARAKEEYMSRLEKTYNERNKIDSRIFATMYYLNFLEGEPIPSIEQNYQIMSMIVPNIPVEAINGLLPELIDTDGKNLVVINYNTEKDGANYPTQESLKHAFETALSTPVEAFVDNVKQEPLISKMPKAGKIVKESENKQFGYKELELSNGARVILKKTDFKDDEIQMQAMQRGGRSLYDEKDWANLNVYNSIMNSCGLGEFSNSELQKALAGKQAMCGSFMDTFYDVVIGRSNVKDLETMFQLTYLNFTDKRMDEKSFNQTLNKLEAQLKNKNLVPENVMNDTLVNVLNNHNWYFMPMTAEAIKDIDLDRVMKIAKERTTNAAGYTFYFVGNIDEATIRPLIEQYIASLPGKKGSKSNWKNVATHPVGQNNIKFSRPMETPKTSIQTVWFDDKTPYSVENEIKADILGKILDKIFNQKIREDAGAAYSTGAYGTTIMKGDCPYTFVRAICPVKPEFTDQSIQIINDALNDAGKDVDAATLEDFKNELIKDFETNLKENSFWMEILSTYLERGIDCYTGYEQIVKAQTPESISAFARQLQKTGNKVEVVMMPTE